MEAFQVVRSRFEVVKLILGSALFLLVLLPFRNFVSGNEFDGIAESGWPVLSVVCVFSAWALSRHQIIGLSKITLAAGVFSYVLFLIVSGVVYRQSVLGPICASIYGPVAVGLLVGVAISPSWRIASLAALVVMFQLVGVVWGRIQGSEVIISGNLRRETGFYWDPLTLLTVCAVLMPYLAHCGQNASDQKRRVIWWTLWIAACCVGLTTGFRTGPFALVIPSIIIVGLNGRVSLTLLIGLLVAACLLTWNARLGSTTNQISSARSTIGRQKLVLQGIGLFLKNPVTGVGIAGLRMTASGTNPDDPHLKSERDPLVYGDAKNLLIQFAAEYGVEGLALLIAIGWSFVSSNRGVEGNMCRLGGGIAFLILGLTESPFGRPYSVEGSFLFGFLIGSTLVTVKAMSNSGCSRDIDSHS